MTYWKNREVGPIKAISPTTGKIIDVYPQKDARIGSDIDLELRRMPGLLSWWVALRDLAEKHLREVQHAEHNISEDLYAELRRKDPKATETTIKMAVKADPKMRKAFRARMDAEDMHKQLKSQVEAIWEKKWSLMGLTKTAVMERGTRDSM
jgi:hypothetical protein